VDAQGFLADLEAKPTALRQLAGQLDNGEMDWPVQTGSHEVVLAGMGSSHYAAQVGALRLRQAGVSAVAELASVRSTLPPADGRLMVAISAGGSSMETLALLERRGPSGAVALTNDPGSPIVSLTEGIVPMLAGVEIGGVACRTYQHTLVALLRLEEQLTGNDLGLSDVVRRTAIATEHLLATRPDWLRPCAEVLDGSSGSWLVAPAERVSSALQGALMLREGPRRQADGCETGDWSHVDVYLTKTLDYRCLVFTGSDYDAPADEWLTTRRSRAVTVGCPTFGSAELEIRFPDDDDPLVALLTETMVVELIAAFWWLQ